jgi:hypothetical protein
MSTLRNYEIRVAGVLGDEWKDWFEGLSIRHELNREQRTTETVISGSIDQAQLHGIIARIRDLNITVISVNQVFRKEGK